MMTIIKNIFKHAFSIAPIYVILSSGAIKSMDKFNNIINIEHRINDKESLMQLCYKQKEPMQTSPVGITFGLSKPGNVICLVARKNEHTSSSVKLCDPNSREKLLSFKVYNESSLIVHPKKNKSVLVTDNIGTVLGCFSYR